MEKKLYTFLILCGKISCSEYKHFLLVRIKPTTSDRVCRTNTMEKECRKLRSTGQVSTCSNQAINQWSASKLVLCNQVITTSYLKYLHFTHYKIVLDYYLTWCCDNAAKYYVILLTWKGVISCYRHCTRLLNHLVVHFCWPKLSTRTDLSQFRYYIRLPNQINLVLSNIYLSWWRYLMKEIVCL